MKKYRYFMSGMFFPTDNEEYEINIPSPFLHISLLIVFILSNLMTLLKRLQKKQQHWKRQIALQFYQMNRA